ncbi:MAG TPA: pyridoxamine 5'-phosphate oxidase family protein [Blastocatellia bacterium]|nr:pyridoxamine 5'-phosphate oxidase family protein [Blastocatellia bacterium]
MKRLPKKMRAFCQEQKVMRLAFVDAHGYPRVVPVWFVMRGQEFFFGTHRNSAKGRLIQQNPRAGWVIDGGASLRTYKGVSFWGRAEAVTDAHMWKTVWRAIGKKYYGSWQDRNFQQLYTPDTLIFRLTPERVFYWDYSE